jgi:hypothetical protein
VMASSDEGCTPGGAARLWDKAFGGPA